MLIVTRGCSGAGKSTAAKLWVAGDPTRRCRVNSDRIGEMLHGVAFTGNAGCEKAIADLKRASLIALLNGGFDVINDDTYITNYKFDCTVKLSRDLGARLVVWDMRYVPIEVCIERDSHRDRVVGEKEIRRQHALMLAEMSKVE